MLVNNIYHLGLSTNLGDKFNQLQNAIDELNQIGKVTAVSEIYITPPYGYKEQDEFLNIALEFTTELEAIELIVRTQEIEHKMGRERKIKNGPRTIDIDILLAGDKIINSKSLQIPHPEMHKRNFVLQPLSDINSELIHPRKEKKISELKKSLVKPDKTTLWTEQKLKI